MHARCGAPDGKKLRWHLKRFEPSRAALTPARIEVTGHEALVAAGIPTADLVGWGEVDDGRSFVIFEDLAEFRPADKLIEKGTSFDKILQPTADLAARLHLAGLHHRDMYLCHFMIRMEGEKVEVRLIDSARVRHLPRLFQRGRWIVKDLAQFWYSTLSLPITDVQRERWIQRYAQERHLPSHVGWRRLVVRKARQIARHDARLRRAQPDRNVSIPG